MSDAPWVRDEPRSAEECLALLEGLNAMGRIERAGYQLDMLGATLLMNARWLRTMSYVTARDDLRGETWAKCGCAALGVLVEPSHCAKTLAVGDTSKSAVARAGTLFLIGGLAVGGIVHALVSLAWTAIRHLF